MAMFSFRDKSKQSSLYKEFNRGWQQSGQTYVKVQASLAGKNKSSQKISQPNQKT